MSPWDTGPPDDAPVVFLAVPMAPFLAHLADTVAPGNLVVLRTPSALMAACTVVLMAVIAYELGADGRPRCSRPRSAP